MSNSKVRTTKTKLSIRGEHDTGEGIELLRKNGRIKIKWMGHVPVESIETERCNLGHAHKIVKDKHWVWNYAELGPEDIAALIEFLQEPLPRKRVKTRVSFEDLA